MGVGLATTLETKWRYRTGPVTLTGRAVPREYWELRQSDPQKAAELLGGKGYQTRKNPDTGFWEVVEAGERAENDNPADVFNTALKMASKRSFVHAIMNTTAAGEMFTTTEVDESLLHPGGERVNAETLDQLRRRRDELGVAADLYSRQLSTTRCPSIRPSARSTPRPCWTPTSHERRRDPWALSALRTRATTAWKRSSSASVCSGPATCHASAAPRTSTGVARRHRRRGRASRTARS